MRFGEKIVVFIFRPIYRTFFDRLFWWFLARVKVFMLADIEAQLNSIEQHLRTIEEQHRAVASSNAAQWDALEQLLLALFRSSNVSGAEVTRGDIELQPVTVVPPDEERVHAASNIR